MGGKKALWVGSGLHQSPRGGEKEEWEGEMGGKRRWRERERETEESGRGEKSGGEVGIREGGGS